MDEGFSIATARDVHVLIDHVAGIADGIDAAIKACGDRVDAPTRAQWDHLYAAWQRYFDNHRGIVILDPWDAYDEGRQFEDEMQRWQQAITAKGCGAAPAPSTRHDQNVQHEQGLLAILGGLSGAAKATALVLAGVVVLGGGAWAAIELAPVLRAARKR